MKKMISFHYIGKYNGGFFMVDLKGKRLLILGGSRISCEIIRKAREMGIYTLVTDWYPIEKSPAKQMADKALITSTADIDAMVQLIKDENIDGVITGYTDSVLPYYAQICEKAGLPSYGTKEQFEILTNKNKYKALCKEYGVPTVEEYIIKQSSSDEDFKKIKYPVLVKPADSSGARGISICYNKEELITAYDRAVNFSESKEVLVEQYLDGEEVTIFWVFQDGNIYLSGMGNRHVKHKEEGIIPLPVAYSFPSIHIKRYEKEVEPKVKEMLKSIGIENGMMFMQCLVEDGECIVYDIGFRLTGSLEYKLQEAIDGYDPLEMMIRFALTGKMAEDSLKDKITPYWKQYACNVSFLTRPGLVGKINGVEDIKAMPGVVDAVLAHLEGEEIPESARGTLKQIILRAFGVASSQEELEDMLNEIYSKLEVLSPDGENMLMDGFDTSEMGGSLI